MNIPNGMKRFEFYLVKLEELLSQSSKERNPALWLYTNGARTTLFMLESLAKLYGNLHNKKRFDKIEDHFKLLEDSIGAIDYYDVLAKEFASGTLVPANVTSYMQAQAREKIQSLNDHLTDEKWISDKENRISKIRKKLLSADWKEPEDEVKGILKFYQDSIIDLKKLKPSLAGGFTEVEDEVHSLRRKLRWLSIYPQALQGVIQLKESGVPDDKVQKYLTPEIVNSPFNKMPAPGDNTYLLLLEKNYFLALSWIIDALGKLKDEGLRILAVAEALQQLEGSKQDAALEKAIELLGESKEIVSEILTKASAMVHSFFEENNLDKLNLTIRNVNE